MPALLQHLICLQCTPATTSGCSYPAQCSPARPRWRPTQDMRVGVKTIMPARPFCAVCTEARSARAAYASYTSSSMRPSASYTSPMHGRSNFRMFTGYARRVHRRDSLCCLL
ncbi:hypothetical protein C8J57DRAFT_1312746, partial [Mycena rebaudengoi]